MKSISITLTGGYTLGPLSFGPDDSPSPIKDTDTAYEVDVIPMTVDLVSTFVRESRDLAHDLIQYGNMCSFLRRFSEESRVTIAQAIYDLSQQETGTTASFAIAEGTCALTRSTNGKDQLFTVDYTGIDNIIE